MINIKSFVWSYPATVVRIIDGDSYRVECDLGFRIAHTVTVRIARIDCPAIGTPEGIEARRFVSEIMPPGTLVLLQSRSLDKYGRCLGSIVLPDERSLETVLLESGHAKAVG